MPMTARERLLSLSSLNGCFSAKEHFCSITQTGGGDTIFIPSDILKGALVSQNVLSGKMVEQNVLKAKLTEVEILKGALVNNNVLKAKLIEQEILKGKKECQ